MKRLAALVILVAACGGQPATEPQPPTTIAVLNTSTTEGPTTAPTTAPATTAAAATNAVLFEVQLYDFFEGGVDEGDPCSPGPNSIYIGPGITGVIRDSNTGEVLSVAEFGRGVLHYEQPAAVSVPQIDAELFWYCSYTTELRDVPFDRAFYEVGLESDETLTFNNQEVREGYVSLVYFASDAENIRNQYR